MKTQKISHFIGIVMIAVLALGFAVGCAAPAPADSFTMSGGVDAMSPGTITIDGETFAVSEDLHLENILRVGDGVKVKVEVDDNGNQIVVDAEATAAPTIEPTD